MLCGTNATHNYIHMLYTILFIYIIIGLGWSFYKSFGDVSQYRIITAAEWEIHLVSIVPARALLFPISMLWEGRNIKKAA